ncbi:probable inactive shikimate kinase like 1, chloroplastic isoform X2 [Populus alba]|uniref:Shikimate kinase family protein n=2 Tax=Populus TaxID=3689 RepID=A0A4U5NT43_POPAL|nr:probable inactive shikimate kinase like 1, chloroplastic isoform X2 [Populus alba]KAJ6959596.1 inactive shikimate kinase like 1 [Populus alba x Populus x berolinensis]TKR86330.1 shikimate kinase family protein [Populus alba]
MEITKATATSTLAAAIHNLSLSSLSSTIRPRPRPYSHSGFSKFPLVSRPTSLTATCSLPNETTTSTTKVAGADTSLQVKKRAADLSPELKGTSIFLLGMRGPLKTNLGKLLADALRYYYFDSDSLVEEAAGGEFAVRSLKERDEKGFRESETEVLKQLTSMGRLVVCAGDGAVQSSTNLGLLRHGISLWIDVPLDIVARGMVEDKTQLAASESHSEVLEQVVATYEELRAGYATADAKISLQNIAVKLGYDELDLVTTEDLALEVLKEIEKLTRVKKMMEEAARPF